MLPSAMTRVGKWGVGARVMLTSYVTITRFRLKDLLEGKNVQQFMDDLYATDPWEEGADNLIMANFLSIRLRKFTSGRAGVAVTL